MLLDTKAWADVTPCRRLLPHRRAKIKMLTRGMYVGLARHNVESAGIAPNCSNRMALAAQVGDGSLTAHGFVPAADPAHGGSRNWIQIFAVSFPFFKTSDFIYESGYLLFVGGGALLVAVNFTYHHYRRRSCAALSNTNVWGIRLYRQSLLWAVYATYI